MTLYAEFLPTKQRAKCVVLLDVSVCVGFCLFCLFLCLFLVFLGSWCLFGSGSSTCYNANVELAVVVGTFDRSIVGFCFSLSCKMFKNLIAPILLVFFYSGCRNQRDIM